MPEQDRAVLKKNVKRVLAPVVEPVRRRMVDTQREIDVLRYRLGAIEARAVRCGRPTCPRDAEFGVFSQFGEDGIIQWLINNVEVPDDRFIEFGVEDYRQSNTRFLMQHDNWRGLVIDAGERHEAFLRSSGLMWYHDVTPASRFVDRDNVNQIFADHAFTGDIGLLSIDIDGNDYWVWEAITVVEPRIVVIEFNSTFGPTREISIPYDPSFDYRRAHYSRQYFGASLPALTHLADTKGYDLVAVESHGANAFFVRRDVRGVLRAFSASEGWVESRFRNARDESNQPVYLSDHRDRLRCVAHMPVVDVRTGAETPIGALFDL